MKSIHIFAKDMLVLATLLVAAEVALRLVWPQPLNRLLRYVYETSDRDPRGFLYKPGVQTICNNGFGNHTFSINRFRGRDREYGPKKPGEWRILCLGDSFNENQALEFDQIYTELLEADLQKRYPNGCFSVLNVGMAGWSLWSYENYLRQMLPETEADVVTITVSLVSDVVTTAEPPEKQQVRIFAGLPVRVESSIPGRLKWGLWFANEMLESHSHVYVAFRRLTRYPCLWLKVGQPWQWSPIYSNPGFGERVYAPTRDVIVRIKNVCAEYGVPLVIMNVPRSYEILPSKTNMRLQMTPADVSTLDVDRPARLLARLTAELDLPLYDPSSDLAASEEPTYFEDFDHWNLHGNQIVATGLMRRLATEGLLGPAANAVTNEGP